jgi:hypothetical protein
MPVWWRNGRGKFRRFAQLREAPMAEMDGLELSGVVR